MIKWKYSSIVIFFLLLPTISIAGNFPPYGPFKVDGEGFICDWLICGPFPNPGKMPISRGYHQDFLLDEGGEKAIEPFERMSHKSLFIADEMPKEIIQEVPGLIAGERGWKFVGQKEFLCPWKPYHFPSSRIDIYNQVNYPIKEYIVAYASCYIYSPKSRKVKLKIGSDDGYKIWLNHKFIGALLEMRAAEKDQNIHNVYLKEGFNTLLLKIEQEWGGHEFYLRFASLDDQPLTDLSIYLLLPQHRSLVACSGINRINLIGGNLVGYIDLPIQGGSIFPGEREVNLSLCCAGREVNARIEASLEDKNGKSLKLPEKRATLEPAIPADIDYHLVISQPGNQSLRIKVLSSSKEELGILKRSFTVLNPEEIYQGYLNLQKELELLKEEIKELKENIENLHYIIGTKEDMVERRNKRIENLLEKIYQFH